ncbi:hemerythrin domain-containing protein [Gordonia westfalica]|uniref:Hemerythrin HHE cation binding domain-containing protein n=1 Tax=Gordonia westfalica TaxID=158898 RepID=A0A1H2JQJ3_9ACTN|nr:hemerythrin domain-containing protein [Gordonia westfalica]SDU58814.1 Hemerythrin HHE cation binding domain-containing protein [Gordonia westfalica]
MTTHPAATALPIQLRLPGQAAAPVGSIDPFMMYVLHHAFRRDLADFAAAVPRTKLDDAGTWRALADRWTMFAVALHHHHNGEDVELWPLLEERCDETEKLVLEAMDAEHDQIDPLLEECNAGFTTMAAHPDEQTRSALTATLVRAQSILGDHLAHEETDAIAIVQRRMTLHDWEEFEAKMSKQSGLGEMLKMSPMMVKGLSGADREVVFARIPGILKLLIKLGGPRFRRLDGRAFYYLDR